MKIKMFILLFILSYFVLLSSSLAVFNQRASGGAGIGTPISTSIWYDGQSIEVSTGSIWIDGESYEFRE